MKRATLKNKRPLICAPLIGKTTKAISAELETIIDQKPDMIEWRADFFADIAAFSKVVEVAKCLKIAAGNIPFIFTIRSASEGGRPLAITEEQIHELLVLICKNTAVEYVDYELRNLPERIKSLRQIAAGYGTRIIGSFHDFQGTPSKDFIVNKLAEAQKYQLDVAKVAVMPQSLEDVLTLLSATLEAKRQLQIPLMTMSMGHYGAVSRIVGGVFGSAVTFAVGESSSAPGQMPIGDVRAALDIMEREMSK